jgi:hypothetical protein
MNRTGTLKGNPDLFVAEGPTTANVAIMERVQAALTALTLVLPANCATAPQS